MSPLAAIHAAAVTEATRSLHWGVLYISLTNFLIIVMMVVVFILALVVPFPHHAAPETAPPPSPPDDDRTDGTSP